MTKKELESLKPTDLVQNTGSGNSYVVLENLGNGIVVAVKSIIVTNPTEWKKIEPN